jgi:hypothetical protein
MSWGKIDDGFATHPKVEPLSDAALRVWIDCHCWCRRPENVHTNGFVPHGLLHHITHNRYPAKQLSKLVTELVEAKAGGTKEHGLWEPREHGWQFHDWSEYQLSGESKGGLTPAARSRGGKKSAETRSRLYGSAQPKTTEVSVRENSEVSLREDTEVSVQAVSNSKCRCPVPVPVPVPVPKIPEGEFSRARQPVGTSGEIPKHPAQLFEETFETECPEDLVFSDIHRVLAQRCGEPIEELWPDFRAKRRAKRVKAAMPLGWSSDFEGWLRSFARNKRERDQRAPPPSSRVNEYPGRNRSAANPDPFIDCPVPEDERARRREVIRRGKIEAEKMQAWIDGKGPDPRKSGDSHAKAV